MKVIGKPTRLIECIDDVRNIWVVRWNIEEVDNIYYHEAKRFNYKPSLQEIKDLIYNWYNKLIDKDILSGFVWNGMSVWLSTENQFNYKAAYDLAIQTQGASLPIKFKFGTTEKPVYYTFTNLNDLTDFYVKAMAYINSTLEKGWIEKDQINWNKYAI